jgi:hypothetical protein
MRTWMRPILSTVLLETQKMIRVEAPWSDFEGCDFSGAIIDER